MQTRSARETNPIHDKRRICGAQLSNASYDYLAWRLSAESERAAKRQNINKV